MATTSVVPWTTEVLVTVCQLLHALSSNEKSLHARRSAMNQLMMVALAAAEDTRTRQTAA